MTPAPKSVYFSGARKKKAFFLGSGVRGTQLHMCMGYKCTPESCFQVHVQGVEADAMLL